MKPRSPITTAGWHGQADHAVGAIGVSPVLSLSGYPPKQTVWSSRGIDKTLAARIGTIGSVGPDLGWQRNLPARPTLAKMALPNMREWSPPAADTGDTPVAHFAI